MKYVIFDLDGTLADIEARRQKALKPDGSIHWGSFFNPANIVLDKPNEPIVEIYHLVSFDPRKRAVIFSGRSDITEEATKKWFRTHSILPPHAMKMRVDGDYTPDEILKKEWMKEFLKEERIGKEDILFIIDDRKKVVDMWREEGFVCLQCAPGDF